MAGSKATCIGNSANLRLLLQMYHQMEYSEVEQPDRAAEDRAVLPSHSSNNRLGLCSQITAQLKQNYCWLGRESLGGGGGGGLYTTTCAAAALCHS